MEILSSTYTHYILKILLMPSGTCIFSTASVSSQSFFCNFAPVSLSTRSEGLESVS